MSSWGRAKTCSPVSGHVGVILRCGDNKDWKLLVRRPGEIELPFPLPSQDHSSALHSPSMAKKSKNTRRADGASSSSSSLAGHGDRAAPWLRLTALAVLTLHSAFSAYLARDDARLVALVAAGYLVMLLLLFYGGLPLPGVKKTD